MANYEEIPRGQLSTVILGCLLDKDKYGYEIIDEVLKNTNGKISIKQPSLYSSLKRMEEQSLISSYWRDSEIGGRRHYYHLTDLGKKYLDKWKVDVPEKIQQAKIDTTHFAQQENLFNLTTSSVQEKKVENINTSPEENNSYVQFDLFSSQDIITSPSQIDQNNKNSYNQTLLENNVSDKTPYQNPIYTSYEKDDNPQISYLDLQNTNKSFSETISNVNNISVKKYVEIPPKEISIHKETILDEPVIANNKVNLVQSDVSEDSSFVTNENVIPNNFLEAELSDENILENIVNEPTTPQEIHNEKYIDNHFENLTGYIPRQEPQSPKPAPIQVEEPMQDDGVFITERIDVGNLPNSTPWNRRFDFYVSGNSISKDMSNASLVVEDRVKQLYEESIHSSENKKIETIDSKVNCSTYIELQDFYQNQNIKFKPYQKILKKTEQSMDTIRITKLNMLTSLTLFGIYSIISILCGVLFGFFTSAYLNNPVTFIIYPAILLIPVAINTYAYIKSPQKKVAKVEQFKFNVTIAVLSLLLIPIIFAINIFAGFNFKNFIDFSICIIYPIFIVLTYFVYYLVQNLFTKSRKMY